MDVVTGGRKCLVNSNKQTLQLKSFYVLVKGFRLTKRDGRANNVCSIWDYVPVLFICKSQWASTV
jgi:hypothetical protein